MDKREHFMEEAKQHYQCLAFTKSGSQCKNSARPGSEYCHVHSSAEEPENTGRVAGSSRVEEKISDPEARRQLVEELDDLMIRVREIIPDYSPPPLPDPDMAHTQTEQTEKTESTRRPSIIERVLGAFNEDLLDQETWRGMWYMANATLEYQGDLLRRRLKGDYETDEWGLDWELVEASRPFLDFLYKFFWRVKSVGIENIPDYDRTLLVCNQTDQPPWDPTLIMTTILNEHPAQRLVRNLYPDKIPTLPFLSSLMVKMGQAVDSIDNGVMLLEQEELVSVFPEGFSPPGRPNGDRNKVSRFRNTGFVQMALKTNSPIIPVCLSSEEPLVTRSRRAARQGIAKTPILADLFPDSRRRINSPMPLPNQMTIEFGEPIDLSESELQDFTVLECNSRVADMVRDRIQDMLTVRLEQEEIGSS
jgi:1-acyl-sn-glycerol-3-phosphate acyltransferase